MALVVTTLKYLIAGMTLGGVAYYIVCMVAASKFFFESAAGPQGRLPPVSLMIPLCGADCEAYENYASFCRQDYPEYQIVFGVRDGADPSVPIVRKLISDFPETDIELVICPEMIGMNLKVSNLNNMFARVKHEHFVIVDSDIKVTTDYLRSIMPYLHAERVGLVTCLYQAANAPSLASKLEAVGISAEFASGVLVARWLEGMRFALGATMATTKDKLRSVGGFQAIADHLGDDFMLGNLIARAGYEVRLAHHIVQTVLAPVGFMPMLRHQVRWMRGTRVCRPLGYLGLVITYGTAWATIGVVVGHGSLLSLGLFITTLVVRLIMGWLIGVHWLGDKILRTQFWLLPIRDILSFLVWCFGSVGKRVEWRGTVFRLVDDGKMVRVS
jgi:ceramide glucosyltransferase